MHEEQPFGGLILNELTRVVVRLDADQAKAFSDALDRAEGAIFVSGQGRSGLVGRMFAMRLMHMQKTCHIVGDTLCPSFTGDDLLVAISGSGRTGATLLHARQAIETGGRVIALTQSEGSELAEMASQLVLMPNHPSQQFGGSLFEQSCLIFLDSATHSLAKRSRNLFDTMAARHANLQ